ncbi:MAG: uroporphyrinogen-III synthase [Pseudorhodobacter sp.]|nr:uroporphyrinogen-III synthase [Pseudorhodobacter sp.]
MARQSRLPPFLLTRPEAQGDRFASALRARFGVGIEIIDSPLLAPQFLTPVLPERRFQTLIFTSQTGVAAYRRIAADPALSEARQAWCVGDRTAQAARDAGLTPLSAQGDAAALAQAITAAHPAGPLLHLRGQEVRADLASSLESAGIETYSTIVYAQAPQPLTARATALLQAGGDVLVPLFSPRTAALFAAATRRIDLHARLWLASLSPAVATAAAGLPIAGHVIAARPDAAAMIASLAGLIDAAAQA